MIYTRNDLKKPKVWIANYQNITLQQALDILNPDNFYQPIALRRGAYKRLLVELEKDKSE